MISDMLKNVKHLYIIHFFSFFCNSEFFTLLFLFLKMGTNNNRQINVFRRF